MLSRAIDLISILDSLILEGRWIHNNESRSLVTSWTGSSISFEFSGTDLKLIYGAKTERRDKWNGGVPMLAVSITPITAPVSVIQGYNWKLFDPQPDSTLDLIENGGAFQTEVLVKIMVIDWGSILELGALVVNKGATIHRPPVPHGDRLLFIGDSISSGYFVQPDGSPIPGPTPMGCLDAFPHVAQRLLSEGGPAYHFQVDLVAYPGWTLISPSDKERAEGNPLGMLGSYHQISPWDTTGWHDYQYQSQPLAIVIELGTNDQEYYSTTQYKAAFYELLLEVTRGMSLMPQYIWTIPPFSDENQPTELQQGFPAIIEELREEFTQLEICGINNCLEGADTIDGLHPTIKGHKKLGSELARYIRARLVESKS